MDSRISGALGLAWLSKYKNPCFADYLVGFPLSVLDLLKGMESTTRNRPRTQHGSPTPSNHVNLHTAYCLHVCRPNRPLQTEPDGSRARGPPASCRADLSALLGWRFSDLCLEKGADTRGHTQASNTLRGSGVTEGWLCIS